MPWSLIGLFGEHGLGVRIEGLVSSLWSKSSTKPLENLAIGIDCFATPTKDFGVRAYGSPMKHDSKALQS